MIKGVTGNYVPVFLEPAGRPPAVSSLLRAVIREVRPDGTVIARAM
jgi:hypothetical protein